MELYGAVTHILGACRVGSETPLNHTLHSFAGSLFLADSIPLFSVLPLDLHPGLYLFCSREPRSVPPLESSTPAAPRRLVRELSLFACLSIFFSLVGWMDLSIYRSLLESSRTTARRNSRDTDISCLYLFYPHLRSARDNGRATGRRKAAGEREELP